MQRRNWLLHSPAEGLPNRGFCVRDNTVNGNAGGEQWLKRRGLVWVIKQTEGKHVNSVINCYKNNGAF